MNQQLKNILTPMLIGDEAHKQFPYDDANGKPIVLQTGGKITIGIGRNLTDCGLSDDEIAYLFGNDLAKAERTARLIFTNFDSLSVNRQAVVINMAFNLGMPKLVKFRNFIAAVKDGRFTDAKNEMLASLWADQVGERADRLADLMERG